jgi:hypothetical protein
VGDDGAAEADDEEVRTKAFCISPSHRAGLLISLRPSSSKHHGPPHHHSKKQTERKRNENTVSASSLFVSAPLPPLFIVSSGLDNAGKTTILKKINGDDIKSVSPTLGFNIKTFAHGKYAVHHRSPARFSC